MQLVRATGLGYAWHRAHPRRPLLLSVIVPHRGQGAGGVSCETALVPTTGCAYNATLLMQRGADSFLVCSGLASVMTLIACIHPRAYSHIVSFQFVMVYINVCLLETDQPGRPGRFLPRQFRVMRRWSLL